MNSPIHLIAAHDGGNGYMKDAIDGKRYIFPSIMSTVIDNANNKINKKDKNAISSLLNNFQENMDVTLQSNGIKKNGRYLVGNSANTSNNIVLGFNVNSNEGKSSSDISIICLLTLLAYTSLNKFYSKNGELPENLTVEVDKMVTALPIDEIKIPGEREKYINRFLHQHIVTINNFSTPIQCVINFNKVDVQPEGVIGQYGLIGDPHNINNYRNDDIFNDLKKKYGFKKFTGENIEKIGPVISIDIGDGTIDFSVLNGVSPVPRINSSVLLGVGNIVEEAVMNLRQKYPTYGQLNRQNFMKIALRGGDKESAAFLSFIDKPIILLEQQIEEKVKSIFAKLSNQVGLIVISGGGSPLVKKYYEKDFDNIINTLMPFGAAATLWVPARYSQFLNLDGLEFRLNHM
ncbi:ParM/StbA family protein [Limosilactobacillus reuteri]|uniref:ParM/StbA family protein n=1 Tax=Limosilactobacillus reuteri TaxID=1598 RepID=UPI000F4E09EA|nr:ParM/StbA family protein [Limosilactobacillus reuteri]MDZ5436944.1 ParM/StbA family protein [Limosilactobacillus reuteri]UFK69217.1 hypothetical protein IVR12_02328 [Limosilactobacillus reuteri]